MVHKQDSPGGIRHFLDTAFSEQADSQRSAGILGIDQIDICNDNVSRFSIGARFVAQDFVENVLPMFYS